MKPSEFKEIKEKYLKEQKRWKSLKVGDKVYETGNDRDLFEIIIKQISVKERYIIGIDKSQNDKKVKLYGFYTTKELKELGIELV